MIKARAAKFGNNVSFYCTKINWALEFGHAFIRLCKSKIISVCMIT